MCCDLPSSVPGGQSRQTLLRAFRLLGDLPVSAVGTLDPTDGEDFPIVGSVAVGKGLPSGYRASADHLAPASKAGESDWAIGPEGSR